MTGLVFNSISNLVLQHRRPIRMCSHSKPELLILSHLPSKFVYQRRDRNHG